MTRLIDADLLEKEIYKWMPKDQETWMESDLPPIENLVVSIMMTIQEQPTVEPTLYGYKIEHLALIARVMQKEGVTPERAVQIFNDVQTIALKVIDEINGIVERTFEQLAETRGSGDDTVD